MSCLPGQPQDVVEGSQAEPPCQTRRSPPLQGSHEGGLGKGEVSFASESLFCWRLKWIITAFHTLMVPGRTQKIVVKKCFRNALKILKDVRIPFSLLSRVTQSVSLIVVSDETLGSKVSETNHCKTRYLKREKANKPTTYIHRQREARLGQGRSAVPIRRTLVSCTCQS